MWVILCGVGKSVTRYYLIRVVWGGPGREVGNGGGVVERITVVRWSHAHRQVRISLEGGREGGRERRNNDKV